MLYVVYGCEIWNADSLPPYGRMGIVGDPDVFENLEEAKDCAVTRSRTGLTKLAVVVQVPEHASPRVVGWHGWRPAAFGLDFPGEAQDCRKQMDEIREQLLSLEYVTT